ncbi:hypothetical protein FRB94_004715 [Tulasnella sp. JGI-2019a]|nr:hypothetical protein FRB94_004715 [Tulasnella sp. JGI-2019a]
MFKMLRMTPETGTPAGWLFESYALSLIKDGGSSNAEPLERKGPTIPISFGGSVTNYGPTPELKKYEENYSNNHLFQVTDHLILDVGLDMLWDALGSQLCIAEPGRAYTWPMMSRRIGPKGKRSITRRRRRGDGIHMWSSAS